MFDKEFLASSKQLKRCPRDYIFPIKQEDICDYNPLCFIPSGLMFDNIIMNLFIDSTEQITDLVQKHLFSKIQNDKIHLYKGSLYGFTWKGKNADTKNTLRLHHFIEKEKSRKYLYDILSIDNYEADVEKKRNQFINDINDFNNKNIIQYNNKPISNIPVDRNYIFSLIWRCYGPKRDILDYWGTILYCFLSYYILSKDKGL